MARRLKILADLNYANDIKAFKAQVLRMETNWSKNGYNGDPYNDVHVNEMFFRAASAGNENLVKYLYKEYSNYIILDKEFKSIPGQYKHTLSSCIYNGRGTQKNGSFRAVALYLLELGANPAINENEPLKAAKKSSIPMFAGESMFAGEKIKETHDIVVEKLLTYSEVAETVLKYEQTEFYPYFKDVSDIFMF